MNNNTLTNNEEELNCKIGKSEISDIPIDGLENDEKIEIKKSKIIIILYHIGGTLALGLAILGVFVPGLPTTPFALLSAALFAKSSPRMYKWLLNNKILGPRIKEYHRKKGVTRKGKVGVIVFMTCMVLISAYIVGYQPQVESESVNFSSKLFFENFVRYPLQIVILVLGLIGGIVVWFFVPTAKEETKTD
jgi:uncharacterized membrane protein YbaN (DUF454 family)